MHLDAALIAVRNASCLAGMCERTSDSQPELNDGAPSHSNVYIRGWPPSWTEEDLRAVAGAFGEIDSVRLCGTASASVPPHAFVRYVERESAGGAIKALNGAILDGSLEPLVVKSADSDVLPRVLSGTSPSDWW